MMKIKKIFLISTIIGLLLSYNFKALAEGATYVDMNKIMTNYKKAQELSADIKVKEADLNEIVATAKKDIQLAKVSDKQSVQDKYNKEIKEKQNLYKQQYLEELKKVEDNVQDAIKVAAKHKNITTLYSKSSIVLGGDDLTDDVLTILNKGK